MMQPDLFHKWIRWIVPVLLVLALVLSALSCRNAQDRTPAQLFAGERNPQEAAASQAGKGDDPTADQSFGQHEKTIMVAAAASLKPVMEELETLYYKRTRAAGLTFTFAASGALQMQIEQGAPVDVFVSAASINMDKLQTAYLIDADSRINLLHNEIVLIEPSGQNKLQSLADLGNEDISHIGIGQPDSVPAGFYANQAIETNQLSDVIENRLVLAKDVMELMFWAEGGYVDAALVYATDAKRSDKVRVVCTVPQTDHDPIVYPAAMIASSDQPQASQEFLTFLQSEAAGLVFESYGFER